jgi:hypothetical protein
LEGVWKQGSRSGPGLLYKKDGTVVEQFWNEPPDANYSIKEPPKYPEELTKV